ncbi:MAG: TraR/DksA C4-type zinc finger protein [Actinomycetota bacterium]|jgi:RNA polymerase-binding transcription factor DksA|nr:TraR/DksA C4-type zinc finger protein [Actinomycetota bacterium]
MIMGGEMQDAPQEPARADVERHLADRCEQAAALETSLAADLDAIIRSSVGANADDEHDPEGSTIAFERAQVQALLEQARARRAELSRAMERVRDGSYGTCVSCGQQIAGERLEARPSVPTCIRCAR